MFHNVIAERGVNVLFLIHRRIMVRAHRRAEARLIGVTRGACNLEYSHFRRNPYRISFHVERAYMALTSVSAHRAPMLGRRGATRHLRRLALAPLAALLFGVNAGACAAESILFVGNSFTYGARSPVWKYRAGTVTDLNGLGVGGVPALFKLFTTETKLHYDVSVEAVSGQDLDFHLRAKSALLDRAWDHVVLQSESLLNRAKPGDPALLIASTRRIAKMLHKKNLHVDILLTATWSRADQVYPAGGHWHGQAVEAMAKDVRRAYDAAAAASPYVRGVIPVGEAWNRAFAVGFADPNPYDGIAAGKVNLWSWDNHHASAFGYYLEALVVFGRVTGRDPRSLGADETAAAELGLSPSQAATLQQIAHDELNAHHGR